MLMPVLEERVTAEQASKLLGVVAEVRDDLNLKPLAWTVIDSLLNQLEKACHRRIRGDA